MSIRPDYETANLSRLDATIKLPMSRATYLAMLKAAIEQDMGVQQFVMFCVKKELERREEEEPPHVSGRRRYASRV